MAKMNQKRYQKIRHQARLIVANVGASLFVKAQGGKCPICQGKLSPNQVTIDHVWPLHIKNINAGNLLLCHYSCNQEKAERVPTHEELNMLEIVNKQLSFDPESGRYGCRQTLINKYYKISLWLSELHERNATLDEITKVEIKLKSLEKYVGLWIDA